MIITDEKYAVINDHDDAEFSKYLVHGGSTSHCIIEDSLADPDTENAPSSETERRDKSPHRVLALPKRNHVRSPQSSRRNISQLLAYTTCEVPSYYDNGTIAHSEEATLGKNPVGMVTYQPTWMSATFMSSRVEDRPPTLDTNIPSLPGPDDEWALIGKHTMAYAGPWHVSQTTEDKEVGQLTHGPTWVAWLPSWVGRTLVKDYKLYDDGNTLRFLYKTSDGNNGDMFFRKLTVADDDSVEGVVE